MMSSHSAGATTAAATGKSKFSVSDDDLPSPNYNNLSYADEVQTDEDMEFMAAAVMAPLPEEDQNEKNFFAETTIDASTLNTDNDDDTLVPLPEQDADELNDLVEVFTLVEADAELQHLPQLLPEMVPLPRQTLAEQQILQSQGLILDPKDIPLPAATLEEDLLLVCESHTIIAPEMVALPEQTAEEAESLMDVMLSLMPSPSLAQAVWVDPAGVALPVEDDAETAFFARIVEESSSVDIQVSDVREEPISSSASGTQKEQDGDGENPSQQTTFFTESQDQGRPEWENHDQENDHLRHEVLSDTTGNNSRAGDSCNTEAEPSATLALPSVSPVSSSLLDNEGWERYLQCHSLDSPFAEDSDEDDNKLAHADDFEIVPAMSANTDTPTTPMSAMVVSSPWSLSSLRRPTPRTRELASTKRQLEMWKTMAEQLRAREEMFTAQIDSLVAEMAIVLDQVEQTESERAMGMSNLEAELQKEQEFGFLSVREAALSIEEKARLESALLEAWEELDYWRSLGSPRDSVGVTSMDPTIELLQEPPMLSSIPGTTATIGSEESVSEAGDSDALTVKQYALSKAIADIEDMADVVPVSNTLEETDDASSELSTICTCGQFTRYTASCEILRLWWIIVVDPLYLPGAPVNPDPR
ncbi:hypothetical protein BGZ73_008601 [Actinomortierella ambigua]|nr:hypothetical protein BGZ73_008601 [Actinomortierella ambigua]